MALHVGTESAPVVESDSFGDGPETRMAYGKSAGRRVGEVSGRERGGDDGAFPSEGE